eukprot:g3034.t1
MDEGINEKIQEFYLHGQHFGACSEHLQHLRTLLVLKECYKSSKSSSFLVLADRERRALQRASINKSLREKENAVQQQQHLDVSDVDIKLLRERLPQLFSRPKEIPSKRVRKHENVNSHPQPPPLRQRKQISPNERKQTVRQQYNNPHPSSRRKQNYPHHKHQNRRPLSSSSTTSSINMYEATSHSVEAEGEVNEIPGDSGGFQTARHILNTQDRHKVGRKRPPPQQQPQSNNPYNSSRGRGGGRGRGRSRYSNPHDDFMTNRQSMPNRNGVKRKFEPPRPLSENSSSRRNPHRSSNRRGNGGGKSSSGNAGRRGNVPYDVKPPGEEGSDDELPEELKGCDKKLVEMISNEIVDSGPKVSWNDIAGLDFAKRCMKEAVILPMLRPDIFTGLRRVPKGLLLFGPPGTGKTMIGKAIASESGACFFSISASSLTSKWCGEGEKLVRTLFAIAAYREPAVIFIDEIDSLLKARSDGEQEGSRRIKTEFLVQLDGVGTSTEKRVLVIGATNRPQELDEAARRRFVKRLYITLPTDEARGALIKRLLQKNKSEVSEEEIATLVVKTKGYSGSDLHALCTEASMGPIRDLMIGGGDIIQSAATMSADNVRAIRMSDFVKALRQVRASVAQTELKSYVKWNEDFGSFGSPENES